MYDRLTQFLAAIEEVNTVIGRTNVFFAIAFYLISRFAVLFLLVARFLVATPVHIAFGPRRSFERLASRDVHGTYQRSYSSHLREERMSVALATLIVTLVAVRVITVVIVTRLTLPSRPASAVSTSVTLNPTWDRTAYFNNQVTPSPDCNLNFVYNCESASATTLKAGLTQVDVGCGVGSEDKFTYRGAMQFSLAGIPDSATITDVDLDVNVSTTTSTTITILRTSVDNIQASSCTSSAGSGMYARMGTGTTYVSASDWTTTGAKTYDLGATADSDVQARIASGDIITIAFSSATEITGAVASADAAANKPQLTVSYTAPPQAPTGASHSANASSTITWSWTDNATADTSNVVHDGGHAVKCTTGTVSGTGSTGTCQETTLAANTQYTRHINVIDNEGNTDSSSASAYTSIETPTGVTFSGVTATAFTATASGAFSNLSSGSSGVYCQESVTNTNSDWIQTTSWDKSGLTANTQYSVQCKARNGDSDETSLTSAATKYTLAVAPAALSARTTATWYTSPSFDFTHTSWGAGGAQYLRAAFVTQASYTFSDSEATWSNLHANCPSATCATLGNTLTMPATSASQAWYLHLQSYNAEDVASGTQVFGPFWFDGTAPTVSNVSSSSTSSTITASWTTDEPSTSQVEYGTTTSYGSLTTLESTLTTTHSVTVAGLPAGTSYQLRVRSRDAAGNETVSANSARATALPDPATVTAIQVSAVTDTSATIAWTTSLPATSQVEYGATTEYGSIVVDTESATSHQLGLTGLTPSTAYHFRIGGLDANNQAVSSTDQSFATSEAPLGGDLAAPVIDSPAKNEIVFDRRPTFRGTSTAGATVTVSVDTVALGTATANATGAYSFRPEAPLPLGFHTARATASVGDVTSESSLERIFVIGAASTSRTIAAAKVSATARPTVRITGRAKANGYVRIILDGKTVKTLRLTKGQAWNHNIVSSKTLAKGRHVVALQFLTTKKVVTSTSRLTTFTVRR